MRQVFRRNVAICVRTNVFRLCHGDTLPATVES